MNLLDPDRSVCRWPSPHTRDWLASFLERAKVDKNVVAVIVIGSAIRPNVASDDLDVMVLCRDMAQLREKAPIDIDLRKADLDCAEDKIRAGHDLLVWAVRFGRPLLDKDGAWAGITRRWTNSLPLPDPTVQLDRAEAARRRMEKCGRSETTRPSPNSKFPTRRIALARLWPWRACSRHRVPSCRGNFVALGR